MSSTITRVRRAARTLALAAAAGAALLSAGCLERIERITVHQDTSAEVVSIFKGDAADMNAGDAIPQASRGWTIDEQTTKAADGGITTERRASLVVPAGGEIPGSYAADPATQAAALRFPTTLTTEVRGDGMYYHFSRVYEARLDAPYVVTKRRVEQDKRLRALAETDATALTRDDRKALLEAFRGVELDKYARYVAAGVGAWEGVPQDVALRVRSAVVDAARGFDVTLALDLLEQPETPERNDAIEALARKFEGTLRDAAAAALDAEALSPREREAFLAAYDAERRSRDVTEDLMDERWEVRVTLPGDVVAHNADAVENGTLVWTFDGAALMDMSKELRATSVVRGEGR